MYLALISLKFRQYLRLFLKSAFGKDAILVVWWDQAIAYGIKRGVYSSEAGMGTTPQAAAICGSISPGKVGLTQALSVYVDTLLVCTRNSLNDFTCRYI